MIGRLGISTTYEPKSFTNLLLNAFFDLSKISAALTQGEYYNADEVQAMVAAEVLEEKKRKQEEEDMFEDICAETGQVSSIREHLTMEYVL